MPVSMIKAGKYLIQVKEAPSGEQVRKAQKDGTYEYIVVPFDTVADEYHQEVFMFLAYHEADPGLLKKYTMLKGTYGNGYYHIRF